MAILYILSDGYEADITAHQVFYLTEEAAQQALENDPIPYKNPCLSLVDSTQLPDKLYPFYRPYAQTENTLDGGTKHLNFVFTSEYEAFNYCQGVGNGFYSDIVSEQELEEIIGQAKQAQEQDLSL